MKKFAALSLSFMMMITNVFAGEVTVKLNDEDVSFPNQEPVIVDGRTLIPLRSIFESLGYEIEWVAETKTAILKKSDSSVEITANNDTMIVDGDMAYTLDVPAQIINGSMMLPLRAIGEASGLKVGWDNNTKTVTLDLVANDNAEADKVVVGEEMQNFYDNLKSHNKLNVYMIEFEKKAFESNNEIIEGFYKGMLAYSKAAEKVDKLVDFYNVIYKEIDTTKMSDDCKTAKAALLDLINDYKKFAEIDKNMFTNVYPDAKSAEEDLEANYEQVSIHSGNLSNELSKINNQYMRTMFKYFDTEKDTEENRAKIDEFVKEIGKIDQKYPLPEIKDIKNDDEIISENIDINIEKINTAITEREKSFKTVVAPENCRERLELIICSNDALKNLVSAFECYKDYGNSEYNPYALDIELNMNLYDVISTLASDKEMKCFEIEGDQTEYDFETHKDTEYKSITSTDVSDETNDFVNRYYYREGITNFYNENSSLNLIYEFLMDFDSQTVATTRKVTDFFKEWKESQNEILNNLKNFTVSEDLMDLKSAVINYITIDIQLTNELEKYYNKTYAEDKFENIYDEIEKKLDAAYDAIDGELSRVDTLIESYIYDYIHIDSSMTEYAEVEKFAKAVSEINEKYPIFDKIEYEYEEDGDSYTQTLVNEINENVLKYTENNNSRKEEYAKLEVPKSCEKRAEILLALSDMLADCFKNVKNINSKDKDLSNKAREQVLSSAETYLFLNNIITNFDYEDEEVNDK